LNAPLNAQTKSGKSFFQRALFHQELLHKKPRIVNDDIWTFNTQISSQWDGLRHYAYQKEELFYGGVTLEDIHGEGFSREQGGGPEGKEWNMTKDTKSTVNGIQGTLIFSCLLLHSLQNIEEKKLKKSKLIVTQQCQNKAS